jgi:molybdopterin converting factor small subunit
MKVTVHLFGPLAERAGRTRLEVAVAEATVRGVVDAVVRAVPGLAIDRSVRFAVNADYAEASARLREGDVVSLIPPVGGG